MSEDQDVAADALEDDIALDAEDSDGVKGGASAPIAAQSLAGGSAQGTSGKAGSVASGGGGAGIGAKA